jgi:hypothetical protein
VGRKQMAVQRICRVGTRAGIAAVLTFCGLARAQQPPAAPEKPPNQAAPLPGESRQNAAAPCVEPAPMLSWDSYNGPLKKTVGVIGRRLDRKSVHPQRAKPGAGFCTFAVKEKFFLFVEDTFDPITFLAVGFSAGLDQAQDNDHKFGQGAQGYGKRFGANFVDRTSSEFFKDFAYPAIFKEDPRYYRLAQGSGGKRFLHAVEHVFVTRRENGRREFNFSEWMGTTSAVAVANLYHPGNKRGFQPAARRVGYSGAFDMGFDVLREFWPEIARKLKLPFRGQR